MRLNHLLVPTDFGDSSEQAEALAVELASTFGAKLTLLHVWSVPASSYAEGLAWPIDSLEAAARDALGRAHLRLKARHANTDALLGSGVVWSQILAIIQERSVDMVVMGTHGRRGLSRAFLGSVAERIVRLSPVPVLTVSVASA
jgi:nucleotide-binding universal stress UspA family protein